MEVKWKTGVLEDTCKLPGSSSGDGSGSGSALMYADSVEKRVARRAVECKETDEVPPCISTQAKARAWESKIMKAKCYTKTGTDRSPPNFRFLIGYDGLPVLRA